jgi:hypothetical protein
VVTEVVNYIIKYYSSLLTGRESIAYKHLLHDEKLVANDNVELRERMRAMMLRVGWLSSDEEVLTLLEDGIEAFRMRIAEKIYNEHGGEALLNKCPRCYRLARTPQAKQCRYCRYDWHENGRPVTAV